MLLLDSSVRGLFKWRQFEPEVILLAVGWYLRFSLSYRDVEELLAERGLRADHVTVWRRVQRYAPELERRLRQRLKATNDSWRVDETYVRVKGKWGYGGSGPSQLALTLVADALGSNRAGDQLALGFYQDFKWRVISAFAQELPWKMTQERVLIEVRDLILEDLSYGASRVAHARNRLVSLACFCRVSDFPGLRLPERWPNFPERFRLRNANPASWSHPPQGQQEVRISSTTVANRGLFLSLAMARDRRHL